MNMREEEVEYAINTINDFVDAHTHAHNKLTKDYKKIGKFKTDLLNEWIRYSISDEEEVPYKLLELFAYVDKNSEQLSTPINEDIFLPNSEYKYSDKEYNEDDFMLKNVYLRNGEEYYTIIGTDITITVIRWNKNSISLKFSQDSMYNRLKSTYKYGYNNDIYTYRNYFNGGYSLDDLIYICKPDIKNIYDLLKDCVIDFSEIKSIDLIEDCSKICNIYENGKFLKIDCNFLSKSTNYIKYLIK